MEKATRLVLTVCRVVVDTKRLISSLTKLSEIMLDLYYNNNTIDVEVEILDALDSGQEF